jgi:DNA-binding HxlR family transcriptional regulator
MRKTQDKTNCSLVQTIEIIGDRWSLLILREAFFGVKRFDIFQSNLKIATNILSERLKRLVKDEILQRTKDPDDARRFIYKFSEKGLDLYSIVLAMINWGDRWTAGDNGPPLSLYHKTCGHSLEAMMCCSHCGKQIHAREVRYEHNPY